MLNVSSKQKICFTFYSALNTRIKCQEMQAKHQQGRLDSIAGDISKLQKNQQVLVRAFSISSPTHRDGKLANDIGL